MQKKLDETDLENESRAKNDKVRDAQLEEEKRRVQELESALKNEREEAVQH